MARTSPLLKEGEGVFSENVPTFFEYRSIAMKNLKNWSKQTLKSFKRRTLSFFQFFHGWSWAGAKEKTKKIYASSQPNRITEVFVSSGQYFYNNFNFGPELGVSLEEESSNLEISQNLNMGVAFPCFKCTVPTLSWYSTLGGVR